MQPSLPQRVFLPDMAQVPAVSVAMCDRDGETDRGDPASGRSAGQKG
jgi:hypothetical protein